MTAMYPYPYPWPIGTCHFSQLPLNIQEALGEYVTDGILANDESLTVHQTATEGPYVSFAGWKVRVTIENTSPTTYVVHLV